MKAQYICTVRRAQVIIVLLWLFAIFYNSMWLFLTTTKAMKQMVGWNRVEKCTFSQSRLDYLTIYMLDLIMFYSIPLILAFVLYGRIAWRLMSSEIEPPTNPYVPVGTTSRLSGISKKFSSGVGIGTSNGGIACGVGIGTSSANRAYCVGTGTSNASRAYSVGTGTSNDGIAYGVGTGTKTSNFGCTGGDTGTRTGNCNRRKPPPRSLSLPKDGLRTRGSEISTGSLRKHRGQVVRMLAAVVVVFAICWLPYRAIVVYNSFVVKKWINQWLFSFHFISFHCIFFIY